MCFLGSFTINATGVLRPAGSSPPCSSCSSEGEIATCSECGSTYAREVSLLPNLQLNDVSIEVCMEELGNIQQSSASMERKHSQIPLSL